MKNLYKLLALLLALVLVFSLAGCSGEEGKTADHRFPAPSFHRVFTAR